MTAALYEARISHVRAAPLRNAFTYRAYYWYVDLADPPRVRWPLRPLAGFRGRDHFDDPRRGIRENLDRLLAGHGIDLRGGRVTMLAHARVFGYVFNPISVYWCHDDHDDLTCVVAEVHNTYGQRHAYVLRPDADGTLATPKEFYVSPFYDVSGAYRMRLPEPGAKLSLTISLRRDGEPPFVAGVRGTRRPATTGALLAAAARHPFTTLVGSALIRYQGIKLYLRRLPVTSRPTACPFAAARFPSTGSAPVLEETPS